ncbi:MAG: hypothetical protein V7752_13830 [Halopseudomonas sp.]
MEVYKELIVALDSEDDLGKVIRSQIIVESIIVKIIESTVVYSHQLKPMELSFEQKIHLALALGLDNSWSKPLKCIGTIRNKFAHNLRGQIDKSDSNNFYKSFSQQDKSAMRALYKEKESEFKELGYPEYEKLEPVHKFSVCITILAGALDAWSDQQCKSTPNKANHNRPQKARAERR